MAIEHVDSLDDPRAAPYRSLKDRELAREGDRFIVEGDVVVRRFLASGFVVESVLAAQRRVERIAQHVPEHVPLYVVPDEVAERMVGFRFQSGVLACGRRQPHPTIDAIATAHPRRMLLVICPEIANTENLGTIIRVAAGFGADAMVLGERSCDPFFRQSIRVSMGAVFRLPIVRSQNLLQDMSQLKQQCDVELMAAVLDEEAEPLGRVARPAKLGILFGNEAQGLSQEHLDLCDHRITIPMQGSSDSLNVSVAAGVFLYHFTRAAEQE